MRLVAVCALLIAVGLVAGCAAPAQQAPTDQAPDTENQQPADDSADQQQAPADTQGADGPDRTIVMTGENYDFYVDGEQNPTITVQQGEQVRLEFSSTEGFHDVVIDELGVASEQVSAQDGMTVVTFTADQAGEFEYYCSVGSHRQQGMFGTFIVE